MILDVHGVIFNNPFKGFLADLADRTGQTREAVIERWYRDVRILAWTGAITEQEIWQSLSARRGDTECWQALLETHYTLGPVAPMLKMWSQIMPLWILSNHRSPWLHRRLKRFQVDGFFDRVIVSDEVGLAKPDSRLFEYTAAQLPDSTRGLFIDDQDRNVQAASAAGLIAFGVNEYLQTVPSNPGPPIPNRPDLESISIDRHATDFSRIANESAIK